MFRAPPVVCTLGEMAGASCPAKPSSAVVAVLLMPHLTSPQGALLL